MPRTSVGGAVRSNETFAYPGGIFQDQVVAEGLLDQIPVVNYPPLKGWASCLFDR